MLPRLFPDQDDRHRLLWRTPARLLGFAEHPIKLRQEKKERENVMRNFYYLGCAAIAASLCTTQVHAQSTVYLPDVVELSGPGAVSGTNWRDGAGARDRRDQQGRRHIGSQDRDRAYRHPEQSRRFARADPEVLDRDPYVVLGPIYSGSVKVNMALTQQAEVPQIVGAEAADITQQGNPWGVPHRLRPADQHAQDRQLSARQIESEVGGVGLGQQ